MKVLVAHNAYRLRGGEDVVADAEIALLRRHGHEVLEYRRHNDELAQVGRVASSLGAMWSTQTTREAGELLQRERPDVLHVHNTWPLISPSLYWAAQRLGVPVVQTLHNFRLLCPQATLLRDGKVCEKCVGHAPWAGVVHRCYRDSALQSATLAGMLVLHRGLGTWARKIDRYIALNTFCRGKFIEGGLPAERIAIKPNFVDLDAPPPTQQRQGLLYVGRLSHEKGVATLAEAASMLSPGTVRVVGDGPMADVFTGVPAVRMLGSLAPADVAGEMRGAAMLVLPSICYESFPRTLIEAWASGLPVLASRLGALPDLIEDGVTGLLAIAGDAADFAAKMRWALEHPDEMAAMGRRAREVYERGYTGDVNHRQLMQIYEEAVQSRRAATPS